MTASTFTRGIRENRAQIAHQLIQVMLVGFAIGMTRTVVPALAESEFGLERGSHRDRLANLQGDTRRSCGPRGHSMASHADPVARSWSAADQRA
ncbi:hypothetical protein PVW53_14815 [Seohaeicola sp. SP36]|uniref:hypothetical protein n=1 Tax=unclassified Seohaeicola TaxID=2641111 RepID=UPI00237A717D|nr:MULTISPECIES: hypothetical protein [unclassified Seohaeicola]MDD9709401.1 hypothetical protein [Seohaeicola sp. 4SK31]MDD9736797.1 hypothetical protein [Seohaeicola sp. SP36]